MQVHINFYYFKRSYIHDKKIFINKYVYTSIYIKICIYMHTIYLHTHILMKLIYNLVHAIFFCIDLIYVLCVRFMYSSIHTYILAYAGRHLFLVFCFVFFFRFFFKNNDIFEFFHVVSCFSLGGWRIVVVVAVMMVVGSRLNLLL